MALTQESVLSFILEHGGKVRNSELVNNFRSQINCGDPAEKLHNRDLFKRLVNSVAVVRQIDELKFVVVKKRYQDFAKEHDAPPETPLDLSFSGAEAARMIYSDIQNNNMDCPLKKCNYYDGGDGSRVPAGSERQRIPLSRSVSSVDATTVKVLNLSGEHESKARKSGAVFAVIAVKSPQRDPAPAIYGSHPQAHGHECKEKTIPWVTEASAPSVPLQSNFPACKKFALKEHKVQKPRQTEDMHPPGFPQVRPPNKTTRQPEEPKDTESVPLEPLAHEWLVKCAAGLWGQIHGLLLQDTRLAQKKDFTSGFTALHWAAKDGNSEMIHKLMKISRKRGTYINVDSKSHGGYTPLHIAAMHGHTQVMVLLVQRYGASANERDNAGKKAFHYLGEDGPAEVRALLGGLQQAKHRKRTEDDESREQPKGFNTISKLFQPHMGRKHKTTAKFVHDW